MLPLQNSGYSAVYEVYFFHPCNSELHNLTGVSVVLLPNKKHPDFIFDTIFFMYDSSSENKKDGKKEKAPKEPMVGPITVVSSVITL